MNKKTYNPSKRKSQNKKAFSLIELSIVLIIIGLLVAGVTGGASLIRNAELRSVMTEARGYQTAVNSFYAKYNGLPGDFGTGIGTMNATAQSSLYGNANGAIEFINAYATVGSKMEGNLAWQMLKNDNFVTDSFTPASGDSTSTTTYTTQLTGGTNVPASKFKGGGWTFDNITVNSATQNVVILFGGSTPSSVGTLTAATAYTMTGTPTSALTSASSSTSLGNAQLIPTEAFSIDVKLDDGIPTTGKVSSLLNSTSNCSSGSGSSGTYVTTTTYKACALAFQVDPNS